MKRLLLIANYVCAVLNVFQVLSFVSLGLFSLAILPAIIFGVNLVAIKQLGGI
jgi:hypothetical protein